MKLISLIMYCFTLPQQKTVFAINRTSMGATLGFLCLMIFIAVLPEGYILYKSGDGTGNQLSPTFFILSFISFYYCLYVVMIMLSISLIGYIAYLLSRLLKRRLSYQMLWKSNCFTVILPIIAAMYLSLTPLPEWTIALIDLIYIILVGLRMVLVYPRVS